MAESRVVHGVVVRGVDLDAQTRCGHYHTELDVIALRFRCCGQWYSCFECHEASADHPAEVWKADERQRHAVLCGVCGHQLTIAEYLACASRCPVCRTAFNPGCASHRHLYFE